MKVKLCAIATVLLASSAFAPGSLGVARAGLRAPQLLAQNSYPENVKAEYMNQCQRRAVAEGLDRARAQRLCQCTLGRLQARFTHPQFVALNRRAAQTGQTPQALTDIGMACYRQVTSS